MPLTIPTPKLPNPAAVPALRWGLVGTGVAARFARALSLRTRQRVTAVTARDRDKTGRFAASLGVDTIHASVDALAADPNVDAVYVASPHTLHLEHALTAIAAGKHVLIEKPIAMSAQEALQITQAGIAAGVLTMEAMWTRYLPQADVVRQLLADGAIGDVHLVTADFGFVLPYDPRHRLWAPELGGGALLDAGVYPIAFASSVLGTPTTVAVQGNTGPGGVDVRADLMLATGSARALLSTSITTQLPTLATICGSHGSISLGAPFFGPAPLTLTRGSDWNGERATFDDDELRSSDTGIGLQATAFASYVAEGRLQSPLHPHSELVDIMHTIDVARAALT